jgi:hypothetical protein
MKLTLIVMVKQADGVWSVDGLPHIGYRDFKNRQEAWDMAIKAYTDASVPKELIVREKIYGE